MADIAVVTGANRGIGRVVAVELARAGYRVWAGVRDLASGDGLLADAEGLPGAINLVTLDVRDDQSVHRAISAVLNDDGRVDLLVNNAAVPSKSGPTESLMIDDFRDVMETNFYGPIRVMKELIPSMRDRRSGTIVNTSSIGALTSTPLLGPYVAAKCALEGVTLGLAGQLAEYEVTVALVLPGFIRTEILDQLPPLQIPPSGSPYARVVRRSTTSIASQIPHAADPRLVADVVKAVAEGRGGLRNPAGAESQRLFEHLGVHRWTAHIDAYLQGNDKDWAQQVTDLFGRHIPTPEEFSKMNTK